MFKNREIKVTVDKKDKNKDDVESHDDRLIEEKTEAILKKVERVGFKVFGAFCVYVLLDTYRQVQVAKANRPE